MEYGIDSKDDRVEDTENPEDRLCIGGPKERCKLGTICKERGDDPGNDLSLIHI